MTYYSYKLSIQVHLNGLSFCILNTSTKKLTYLNTIPFKQKLTPFDTLNRLKTFLESDTVFSNTFKAIQVIHQNELATIIPNTIYNEACKADYLKFNSKILKNDFLATDESLTNNSKTVYVPYVNINNFIFEKFGAFEYKHAATILIDCALKISQNKVNNIAFINVNSCHFEIIITNNAKLKLYNYFAYNTKEDFIYYVLFVFEQLNLDTEEVPIILSGAINPNDELYNILYTYIKNIEFVTKTNNFNVAEHLPNSKLHQHFLILNSL